MSVLVTGANGFIGQEVALKLKNEGASIHPSSFEKFDVFDPKIPSSVSSVIHLAAAGVAAKNRSWEQCLTTNIIGTVNLINALPDIPIVVGRSFMEDAMSHGSDLWNDPYFSSKTISSILLKGYKNIRFARIFHVYGKNMDGVLRYAAKCLKQEETATFGSGIAFRDWIHVSDAAEGIISLLKESRSGEWDIGTGTMTSLREVLETLKSMSSSKSSFIFDPSRDRADTNVKIVASKFPSSWRPKIEIKDGLKSLLW